MPSNVDENAGKSAAKLGMGREPAPGVPAVTVLVVNYNAGPLLVDCLEGLAAQSRGDFEALVLDNASSDGSFARARAAMAGDARFRFIEAGANLGFAAGNNRLAAEARGRWLALLNPDAVPAPDWLECLMRATETHPDIAMFGSTQIMAEDAARLDGCGDCLSFLGLPWRGGFGQPLRPLKDGEVFGPCAAAALYRRDLFLAEGGFDESFFCYVEDVDLAFRLRLKGERAWQVAAARVRHWGSASSGRHSDFTLYQSYRNRIWLLHRNLPLPLLLAVVPMHLLALLYLLIKVRQPLMPRLRGLRDGLAGLSRRGALRRETQRSRRLSWLQVAKMLNWSLRALSRRAPDSRVLPD